MAVLPQRNVVAAELEERGDVQRRPADANKFTAVLVAALARDSSKAKDFSLLDLRLEAIRGESFIRGTKQ